MVRAAGRPHYNVVVGHPERVDDPFRRILEGELRPPLFLNAEEVAGGWRELFPELAEVVPQPYPIFGRNEEQVITYGYPVLMSAGMQRLRAEIDRQLALEVDYRLELSAQGAADKHKLMAQRERYRRAVSAILQNTLVSDYGRGLVEVFLLAHTVDVQQAQGLIPRLLQQHGAVGSQGLAEELRYAISEVFADLIQRAAVTAVENVKRLSHALMVPRLSPLLKLICHDQLLLSESQPPNDLARLTGYLGARYRRPGQQILDELDQSAGQLRELLATQPQLADVLSLVASSDPLQGTARVLLEPRLLDVLQRARLAPLLGLNAERLDLARDLAMRLKCFELLWAVRQRILRMEMRGSVLSLAGASSATPIAATTRPFDFARPGVVSSSVRRFGLVYDLTNFTALLDGVRKQGRAEEERALQLMYVFQGQLEEIGRRRRLTFEKFLGDGAFYTSRRGLRLIAAACEMQQLYTSLLDSGFPFNQGMRIALNYGSYQLLPMRSRAAGGQPFEFFGAGIVELARLTTGKSTREVEQIAEFLVHSGYPSAQVEEFLAPLIQARSGREKGRSRRFSATLDRHGELVNEGIVLTVPLLEAVEAELGSVQLRVIEEGGTRWTLFPVDPELGRSVWVGLRYMGVARLKGLEACEIVEATVWPGIPDHGDEQRLGEALIDQLRRRAAEPHDGDASVPAEVAIGDDLVVLSYRDNRGQRQWIFGEYRAADDILLHAINIPIDVAGIDDDSIVEVWLLEHRSELAQIYEGMRRDSSGISTPLAPLRGREAYVACFLAAPHKGPQ